MCLREKIGSTCWRPKAQNADGFIFLLGAGFSSNPQLHAEWRAFLRNDWDSKKLLVPAIAAQGPASKDLPPFLRHRKAIYATDFDVIADELQYRLQHPAQGRDRTGQDEARAERETRMNELRDYALALKEGGLGDEAKAE